MKNILLLLLLLSSSASLQAQINIALLHQLVAESKSEHQRQSELRDKHGAAFVTESRNKAEMGDLKDSYRQISSRFSLAGPLLSTLQISLEAAPLISEVYRHESELISLCEHDPMLIPLGLAAQADLAQRSGLLLKFLYGLALSYTELSHMSPSDRKLLFAHGIAQLRSISGTLKGLCQVMRASAQAKKIKKNPFSDFTVRDRALVERILQSARHLKN
ncbi:hypothetical protein G7074_16040 [Pedobacter sp. HDW13]|uniref:hypothetical protein n=1 Tax=Pedobacter sp. HDW13 TaxID=2714940 RepID=UPI001407769A|nr:hypothetical protein [Pedobacter sp. HDW13]QIL40642.1 hypothetical protein G7074_16040 [Pedobacter sp. HDW13]